MPWDNPEEFSELENVIFTRPFSAQAFLASTPWAPKTDYVLDQYPVTQRLREQVLLSQGLRSLTNKKISALATEIAKQVYKRHIRERRPFYSIVEFIDSGVIADAIESSDVNVFDGLILPRWMPDSLTQAHILHNLLPVLTPRGDTFTITTKAEIIDPATNKIKGSAYVQIRVQRMPEYLDSSDAPETSYDECNAVNKRFGRRFKIVNMKYYIP